MMGFVAMSLVIRAPAVLHVGLYSPLLLGLYLLALRSVHTHERDHAAQVSPRAGSTAEHQRRAWRHFILAVDDASTPGAPCSPTQGRRMPARPPRPWS
jgi:cation:H+ antiporter